MSRSLLKAVTSGVQKKVNQYGTKLAKKVVDRAKGWMTGGSKESFSRKTGRPKSTANLLSYARKGMKK